MNGQYIPFVLFLWVCFLGPKQDGAFALGKPCSFATVSATCLDCFDTFPRLFHVHMLLGSPLSSQATPWFPAPPGQPDNNPTVDYKPKNADLYDDKHGIKMGVASPDCDDAKVSGRTLLFK